MKQLFIKLCLFTIAIALVATGPHAEAQSLSATFTEALEMILKKPNFPRFVSENSTVKVLNKNPDAKLNLIFAKIKSAIHPAADDFQLKLSKHFNVSCDSTRKFILVDLDMIKRFTTHAQHPNLVIAAVLSHEISHYLFDLSMNDYPNHDGPLGPSPIFIHGINIAFADYEHANVEGFSVELLVRAGYTPAEIGEAYDVLLSTVQALLAEFKHDPSTDVQTRRAVVSAWLNEKGL